MKPPPSHDCRGKISYLTRMAAQKAMTIVNRRINAPSGAYYCRACGGWHWGKKHRSARKHMLR